MTTQKRNIPDDLEEKVTNLHDLATRIDERVKILIENQGKIETKLENFLEKQIEMVSRMLIFDTRIQNCEDTYDDFNKRLLLIEQSHGSLQEYRKNNEWTWTTVISYVVQGVMAILVGGILYYLKMEK